MFSKICSFYNKVFNYIFFGLCCCREKIFSKLWNSKCRCVKSVHIRNFSSTYSVRTREYTDQKNFEFEHFSCSVSLFMYFLQRYQGNSRNFYSAVIFRASSGFFLQQLQQASLSPSIIYSFDILLHQLHFPCIIFMSHFTQVVKWSVTTVTIILFIFDNRYFFYPAPKIVTL